MQTWTAFFAGSTLASKKVQLLQHGPRFATLIEAQAASPLAQQTKAVVTNDGSEAADTALPYAKALAEGADGRLVVVHVKEIFRGRAGGYPVFDDEDELAKIRRQVDDLRREGLDATLKLGTAVAGRGANVIADAARDAAADVIVVGTRGRSPIAGVLLGSVAQRLLQVAPCPVLAVPAATKARTGELGLELAGAA